MSTEENKALIRRLYEEVFNQRNLALVDELCRPTYVFHNPPTTLHGPEAFKQFLAAYITAFPDARFTIEDQIAEGDEVVTRQSFTGTHQGPLLGISPTSKQVNVTGMTIHHLIDGQIEEGWINFDALGLLQQIGAILGPDKPASTLS